MNAGDSANISPPLIVQQIAEPASRTSTTPLTEQDPPVIV
jgi:hypothetical protein